MQPIFSPHPTLEVIPAPTLQLVRVYQQSSGCITTTCTPDCPSPSTTLRHRHYPLLESEILHLAHHIGTLHQFSTAIDITCVINNVRSLQDGVSEVIHNYQDDDMMLIEETLLLVLHVLRRAKTYRRAPETCIIDHLSKDERNLTDGSGDMPVQSSGSVPTTLVDCSDPADSCAETMTWPDVGDSLATQNFDADSVVIAPKTPDSTKLSQVSTPPSPDYDSMYSHSYLEESDSNASFRVNSMTEPPNPNFSKLSSIDEAILENDDFSQRLFNGSDASDPYCAAVDTATLPTVVKTEPSSPNPPQCAYRAHNETDPSQSLTYLDIQHPVSIKLEDFPMSPAAENDLDGEHCYSTCNNAPSNAPVNFYLADDPAALPGSEIEPEPHGH